MAELDRRTFVAGLGAATLAGMLPPAAPAEAPITGASPTDGLPAPAATPSARPNVIVMICDDIGFGDLGCYGSSLKTPHLDRMAREGARLTQYNTPHPLCSAARAALLTGRYSTRTGARPVYFPDSTDGLSLDEMTLGNVLHDARYRTMCIGKWHLGSEPQYLPTRRGFDSYFGVPYSVDMRPLPMLENETVLEPHTDRALLTPRYTDRAVRFIDEPHTQPFFLYLAYSYPHIPVDASPRFKGKSRQGIYGDAVEEIDWSVGEILSALERNHLDDNTLVVFTGDHGPWYQGSVEQLRGRKGTTYEGGCRVPFLARWKGVIPAGHVVEGFASHLDVVPTVASVCQAQGPVKPVDGANILDLLTGRKKEIDRPGMLYFSPLEDAVQLQCIRRGNWKLRISQFTLATYVLGSPAGQNLMLVQPELYNLADDLGENYDVARDNPRIVAALEQEIESSITTFPENVVQAYKDLRTRPASPTTPEAAPARPASYVSGPLRYAGDPN